MLGVLGIMVRSCRVDNEDKEGLIRLVNRAVLLVLQLATVPASPRLELMPPRPLLDGL